jgi:hypoxanthine phosphoribosyltransferase
MKAPILRIDMAPRRAGRQFPAGKLNDTAEGGELERSDGECTPIVQPLNCVLESWPDSFYHRCFPVVSVRRAMQANTMSDLRVLYSREQIARRVAEMGAEISRDYAGQSVILIGVLKGAAVFLSDLSRNLALDATFDFISVSSYGDAKQNSGEVKLLKDADESMENKNIILVEDILDTGLTMSYLTRILRQRRPKSLKIAVLLDKVARRTENIKADYVGFEIPDEFVVGYGMDYAERYRNLPDICVVP